MDSQHDQVKLKKIKLKFKKNFDLSDNIMLEDLAIKILMNDNF